MLHEEEGPVSNLEQLYYVIFMSRWSLLKSAIVDKERDVSSLRSIHRFTGYNVASKVKIIWKGFKLEVDGYGESLSFLEQCNNFMEKIDTAECLISIPSLVWKEEYSEASHFRVHSRSPTHVLVYAQHHSLISSLLKCEYWRYEITNNDESLPTITLFTREKPRAGGLNVRALLSNKLHGVDNTGNVCVWPAESLLLQTLVTVSRYRELVHGRRVLEIGGGMTALAGLGLAAAGIAAAVTVTDGHPDCVKNQVQSSDYRLSTVSLA